MSQDIFDGVGRVSSIEIEGDSIRYWFEVEKELMKFMKDKEFTNVRKWVVDNLDNDPVRLLRSVYDNLYEYVDGSTIPHCVVVLGEYQYKSAFVADQEVNTMACLTEIMARAKFK